MFDANLDIERIGVVFYNVSKTTLNKKYEVSIEMNL